MRAIVVALGLLGLAACTAGSSRAVVTLSDYDSTGTTTTVSVGAIFPMASVTHARNHVISVSRSKQKTIVVTGATIDELHPEDRQTLLRLAGAE